MSLFAANVGGWSVFVPPLPARNPDPDLVQLRLRAKAEAAAQEISVVFTPGAAQ